MTLCFSPHIPNLLQFGVTTIQAVPGVALEPSRTPSEDMAGMGGVK